MILLFSIFVLISLILNVVQLYKLLKVKKQPTLEDLMSDLKEENFEEGTYNVKEFRKRMDTVKDELNNSDSYELYEGIPLYNIPIYKTNREEDAGVEVITEEMEESIEKTLIRRYM